MAQPHCLPPDARLPEAPPSAHCLNRRNGGLEREHRIGFYAEKMCLTERYLGTVVRQASSITAKEWIDRSLITTAKVMLRHSDRQIVQIAEDLNFPTASFFSKYFKRLTGMTPGEFQGMKVLE